MNRPGAYALNPFSLEFLLFVVLLRHSNSDWSLCAMNPFHVLASRRQRCSPTLLGEEENSPSDFHDPIVVFPHFVHPRTHLGL